MCVQEPCVYLLSAASVVIRNNNVDDIAKGECKRAFGWVRNVNLIKCIFGSGKPGGVGILGGRVYEPAEEMGKSVYEQPRDEVDGSCHERRVPSK